MLQSLLDSRAYRKVAVTLQFALRLLLEDPHSVPVDGLTSAGRLSPTAGGARGDGRPSQTEANAKKTKTKNKQAESRNYGQLI